MDKKNLATAMNVNQEVEHEAKEVIGESPKVVNEHKEELVAPDVPAVNTDPQAQLKKLQAELDGMSDETLVTDYLAKHHKSDVHVVIRDFLSDKRKQRILHNPKLANQFKEIKKLAQQSYDHDHACATNLDVDRACTIVYTTLLKMVAELRNEIGDLEARIASLGGQMEIKVDTDNISHDQAKKLMDDMNKESNIVPMKPVTKKRNVHKKGESHENGEQNK